MTGSYLRVEGLTTPTKDDWLDLPRSREEAIERGINRYIRDDGQVWQLRNYGTRETLDKKRRASRGNEIRRARVKGKEITKKEWRAFAKANGYTQKQADELYQTNLKKLRQVASKKKTGKGTPLHYEHFTPNASEAYGGIEHWRNLGLLDEKSNLEKSDLLITRRTAKQAGIPLTKEDAMRMDFEGIEAVPRRTVRRLIEQDLTSRNPVSARVRNRHVSSIQAPKTIRTQTPDKVRAIANKVGQRAYKTGSYRVGGMLKATTGLSRGESVLRIIGGDYVGGTLGLAMTTPTFQKKAAALLAKQGIKLIPGVSLGSGALQAAGYVVKGQFTKAGLSAIGGVLGELGPAGDAAQAAIDLGLTASDMKVGKKAKLKTKVPDEDDLFETLRRTGKFIDRYGI